LLLVILTLSPDERKEPKGKNLAQDRLREAISVEKIASWLVLFAMI